MDLFIDVTQPDFARMFRGRRWEDMSSEEQELANYTIINTVTEDEASMFDSAYSVRARNSLDQQCRRLLVWWRKNRKRVVDRSFAARMQDYQRQTFYELAMDRRGKRRASVFQQLCALNAMRLCRHFEQRLLLVIAKYLLPSQEQHTVYYGFAGRSSGAAIDCTREPLRLGGEIVTRDEYEQHGERMAVVVALAALDGSMEWISNSGQYALGWRCASI